MKKVLAVVLVVILMLTAAPLSGFVGIELPRLTASATSYVGVSYYCYYYEYSNYIEIIDCDKYIRSLTIPSKINGKPVISIDERAFKSCNLLESIAIPNSVTSIGECAFWGCNSLQSITIPSSVTSIGDGAFEYCNSLKEVYISSISAWCNIDFGSSSANPLSNGAELYLNNNRVENLVIPDGIPEIKAYVFYGCSSLQSITIPDSVKSIGRSAFSGYSSLQSITIPTSVTSIGGSAFKDCKSLQSITIPDSVTSIGDWVFYNCSSLQSITIPDSVTSIGDSAFLDCSSLEIVNYAGTKEQWDKINIAGRNESLTSATINFKE